MTLQPISRRAFTLAALSTLATPFLPLPSNSQSLLAPSEAPPSRTQAATQFRQKIRSLISEDPTIAATLLRLAFHDSFTFDLDTGKGGANGSIRFETGRGENFGLARAVDAIKPIQAETGLGWGDCVAVAGAEAVEATGGPHIDVQLGRDNAGVEDPRGALPSLTETVDELRARFYPRGFDDKDIVALSGAHTLGRVGGGGPFVAESNKFKNDYFKNLLWFQDRRERGLSEKTGPPERPNFQLPSDIHLLDDPKTLALVREYGNNQNSFFNQFVKSYNKMVSVGTPFASR